MKDSNPAPFELTPNMLENLANVFDVLIQMDMEQRKVENI